MSCTSNTPNIDNTFIIETTNGETLSACTMLYANNIGTCGTGDTINILNNVITPSIDAALIYSGGTNILDIFGGTNVIITGFTYDNANTLTIETNIGNDFSVNISTMTGLTINGVFSASTIFGDGSGLDGVQALFEAEVTTTDDTPTFLDTITGIPSDETRFIESYITAHNSLTDYGFWKRTLAVVNISGVTSILLENADTDIQSSGLTGVNIVYTPSGADIDIDVIGQIGTTYNWVSDWNIIKNS